MTWTEHTREAFSVHWNLVSKRHFLSSAWDCSIKLWDPQSKVSLSTWTEHSQCVYQALFSPSKDSVFASVSGDKTLKLWDSRRPSSSSLTFEAHPAEVLSLDWNKYDPNGLVTGSVDKTLRVWDLRNPRHPLRTLRGHDFAIRRVKCSPHSGQVVASASYDMTVRGWDLQSGRPLFVHDQHSEFALGLDFSLFNRSRLATCAWDQDIHILDLPVLLSI